MIKGQVYLLILIDLIFSWGQREKIIIPTHIKLNQKIYYSEGPSQNKILSKKFTKFWIIEKI